jgi:hypothetical protein
MHHGMEDLQSPEARLATPLRFKIYPPSPGLEKRSARTARRTSARQFFAV